MLGTKLGLKKKNNQNVFFKQIIINTLPCKNSIFTKILMNSLKWQNIALFFKILKWQKKKNQELNPIFCPTSQFDLVRLGLVTFLSATNHLYDYHFMNLMLWFIWCGQSQEVNLHLLIGSYINLCFMRVLVSSIVKISCHQIRDLGFKPHLYQKLIGVLVG